MTASKCRCRRRPASSTSHRSRFWAVQRQSRIKIDIYLEQPFQPDEGEDGVKHRDADQRRNPVHLRHKRDSDVRTCSLEATSDGHKPCFANIPAMLHGAEGELTGCRHHGVTSAMHVSWRSNSQTKESQSQRKETHRPEAPHSLCDARRYDDVLAKYPCAARKFRLLTTMVWWHCSCSTRNAHIKYYTSRLAAAAETAAHWRG